MLKIALKFLIGMSCLFWIPNESFSFYLFLIASLFILAVLIDFIIAKPPSKTNNALSFISLHLKSWLFLFIGLAWGSLSVFIWFKYSNALVTEPKVSNLTGYVCSVIPALTEPNISKTIRYSRQSITFDFCITALKDDVFDNELSNELKTTSELSILSNIKIKLSVYLFNFDIRSTLVSGEILSIKAKIKPIHGRINPAGSDYEKWLVAESYIATGYVKSVKIDEQRPQISIIANIKKSYHHQRQKIVSHLQTITANNQFQGLLLALSVGEKALISDQQWQVFRDSGTSHLLAISGLHIGIASVWSYFIVYLLIGLWNILTKGRYFLSPIKPTMFGSIIGGVSIALISGLGYPTQRAVLMLIVFFFNKISSRYYSTPSILSITFVLIVLIQPFSLLSEGFWLSFLAVSIILLSVSYGSKDIGTTPKTSKTLSKLMSWFRVNLFIFVGLTPISWYFFGQVSIVSLGTNLLLIPLTSFLTAPLVYLGLLTSSISIELSSLLFGFADHLLALSFWIQSQFASINAYLTYFDASLGIPSIVLLLVSTTLLLLPSKFLSRSLVLAITFIFLLSFITDDEKINQPFKMIVFDIGQGLAVYIGVDGKHLIYDTGYGNHEFAMADSVILPFLKANNIVHLDKLIISHGDSDHRGGLESILNNVSVAQITSGEEINFHQESLNNTQSSRVQNCHSAKSWTWGSIDFKFLNFRQENESRKSDSETVYWSKRNDSSCVLSISITGQKILLTGDIEKKAEKLLVEQNIEQHDIVIVPHHGSATSSTEDFVKLIRAKDAIFSTGFANQWKFPREKVVERYKRAGANIWITHNQGAISVEIDEGKLRVSYERDKYHNFWSQ